MTQKDPAELFKRARSIAEGALALSVEERDAYITSSCGDDVDLRSQVEQLLSNAMTSDSFLEETVQGDGLSALRSGMPKEVGRYTLRRVIGEGGMGVVYEAVQQSPRRTVALKMIKRGVTSRGALRRFEYEAQTLGRLHHEGIAQIYEAGTWNDGSGEVPWFAMEYLAGAKPLIEYCNEKKLGTHEQLELFKKICEAVQHGHTKGIIHRDLKPSNILVTSAGVPKIIDFGVARSTDSDMAVTTLQTDVGQLIGTLQYMSPEQCDADPNDLDTRSDVYALGVILYELLCGQLPYDVQRKALHEAARIIREEEPTKPSTLDKRLRGDLEVIALKALEKDRNRRYQNASSLEEDITRYLAGETIMAKRPSSWDYLKRFAKRHRAATAAIVATFLILVAAVISISIFAFNAERARVRAESTTDFFTDMLISLSPDYGRVGSSQQRIEQMIKDASTNVGIRFEDEPLTEAEIRMVIGHTFNGLGRWDLVVPQYTEALKIRQRLLGNDHPDTLDSLAVAGFALHHQGKNIEAETYLVESLEGHRRIMGDEHPETLTVINILGLVLHGQGRYDEAGAYYEEALRGHRLVLGDLHEMTCWVMNNMAVLLRDKGRYDEAETYNREAVDRYGQAVGLEHPWTLESIQNLAKLYEKQGRYEEAKAHYQQVLDSREHVLGNDHPDTLDSYLDIGNILLLQGKYKEAEPYCRASVEGLERNLGTEHPRTLASLSDLGKVLCAQGRLHEAEMYHRKSVEGLRRVLGNQHSETFRSLDNLVELLSAQGKYEEAEAVTREALAGRQQFLGVEYPESLQSAESLGEILSVRGKLDESELLLRETLETRRRVLGDEHPDTLASIHDMGNLAARRGEYDEALRYYTEALEARRSVLGDEHPATLNLVNNMGALLSIQGKYDEVLVYYTKALEGFRSTLGEEHPLTITSINNIGDHFRKQGKSEEAMEYFAEALEKRRRVLGDKHPATLNSIFDMGKALFSLSRFDEATPYVMESMEGFRVVLGDEDPRYLQATGTMGGLLTAQGRIDEAMPYHRQALEGLRNSLGNDHPTTLLSIANMGILLEEQGRYDEAMQYFMEALEGHRNVLGDEHPDSLRMLSRVGLTLAMQGQSDRAALHFDEAFEQQRRILGDEHPDTTETAFYYADLLYSLNRLSEAVELAELCVPAYSSFAGPRHPDTLAWIDKIIETHGILHAQDSTAGHDAKAQEWREEKARRLADTEIDELESATQ